MEASIRRRYRIRTRPYLCLTPAEAAGTGVTVSEETVEELTLVMHPGLGIYEMYAVIRDTPEEEMKRIPAVKRGELVFEKRPDASKYAKERGEPFVLCGVKSTRMLTQEEISRSFEEEISDTSIEQKLKELKDFYRKI
ncbi:MAG: hypothetical protein N2115_05055 [bacterium]|nr:hypothetical protein [bacterium]